MGNSHKDNRKHRRKSAKRGTGMKEHKKRDKRQGKGRKHASL